MNLPNLWMSPAWYSFATTWITINALSLRYVCLYTSHKARLVYLKLWIGADVAFSCTVLCLVLHEIVEGSLDADGC